MAAPANTRCITAHIPSELADRLDALAKREQRSKNWIVKQALTVWISHEERQGGKPSWDSFFEMARADADFLHPEDTDNEN